MHRYTIFLQKESDGRFSVTVPALPGCTTWGDDIGEAVNMAHEAIELYLEDLIASGESVPEDVETVVAGISVAIPSSGI
jgi:predicted RNase H-like HicB family nuclease